MGGHIVHTVPPLYGAPNWAADLTSCYIESLRIAWSLGLGTCTVAIPLLGSGARGAPVLEAVRVAAGALTSSCGQPCHRAHLDSATTPNVIRLVLKEESVAAEVETELSSVLEVAHSHDDRFREDGA